MNEAVQLLREELSTISAGAWENLPDLKKKKVVLASRLSAVDWSPPPHEGEAFDLKTLCSLITDLEEQSRQKIKSHLKVLGDQFFALQDQHQYWRECLNVSFRRFYAAIPIT